MPGKTFRELISNRDLKFGTFLGEFATPGIGHILGGAGLDFVFVDLEHTGFTYETLKSVVRYLSDAGVASLVRPPSSEYHHLSRVLDVGGEAVIPPMMTLERAQEVVHHIKYPPDGGRGVAFAMAHDRYQPGPAHEKVKALNKRTCFIALIETVQGVEEVAQIAALDGVDGMLIGHFDLSCSMGIPGEFEHPDFLAAIETIKAAAKSVDKSLGRMAMTPEESAQFYADGFDLQLYSGDIWMLQSAYAQAVAKARKLVADHD